MINEEAKESCTKTQDSIASIKNSKQLDFGQGAVRDEPRSLQIVNEEANESCNKAQDSIAKSINVALYQPEIPPNTGNIIRLCANAGIALHLIKPLGFVLDDKKLQRAGLDYHEFANIKIHEDFDSFLNVVKPSRIFAATTKAKKIYTDIAYQPSDVFLFGPETRGLPTSILENPAIHELIRIPMQINSRSLNLSNSCSVIVYEACRQIGFDHLGLG